MSGAHRDHPSARSIHRRRWAVPVAAVATALALIVGGSAAPASAQEPVDPLRVAFPAVAGSRVISPTAQCTAGAVLTSGYISFTQYSLKTRYILFAAHCASLHDDVTIGNGIHGTVTWRSSVTDTAIITVPPFARHSTHCNATSLGPHCTIITTYDAQAVGRVVTLPVYTRTTRTVPVEGTGTITPSSGTICTSGITTGVQCGYSDTSVPATWAAARPGVRCLEEITGSAAPGDSGGPVMNRTGTLYGIVLSGGRYGGVTKTCYFPIETFLEEHRGYALVRG
jgi:hypothetical protein